jgi:hypothetical protein
MMAQLATASTQSHIYEEQCRRLREDSASALEQLRIDKDKIIDQTRRDHKEQMLKMQKDRENEVKIIRYEKDELIEELRKRIDKMEKELEQERKDRILRETETNKALKEDMKETEARLRREQKHHMAAVKTGAEKLQHMLQTINNKEVKDKHALVLGTSSMKMGLDEEELQKLVHRHLEEHFRNPAYSTNLGDGELKQTGDLWKDIRTQLHDSEELLTVCSRGEALYDQFQATVMDLRQKDICARIQVTWLLERLFSKTSPQSPAYSQWLNQWKALGEMIPKERRPHHQKMLKYYMQKMANPSGVFLLLAPGDSGAATSGGGGGGGGNSSHSAMAKLLS